ncbi:MAG: GNAT family N-acetyltransferase [Clostridia bacterium]|nr:GNAT family N-acetyltransferase [Clostridia bacterium]
MEFRKATKKDLDRVMQIILDARTRIGKLGIDQWQYGYPTRDIVKEDMALERYFVGEENGEILSVFAMIDDGEPTYDTIYDGSWLTGDEDAYVAVHRIAVAGHALGKGVASESLRFVAATAIARGFVSIRIDTHEGNIPMRRMLEKNGFVHCGTIYLTDGEMRVAYEKQLEER